MDSSGINNIRISPNFLLREFACKDGSQQVVLHEELLRRLQALRDLVRRPVLITSGYRNPAHNQAVGGHPQSLHLRGMAADITVAGMQPAELKEIATAAGFKTCILYRGHLHVDLRD